MLAGTRTQPGGLRQVAGGELAPGPQVPPDSGWWGGGGAALVSMTASMGPVGIHEEVWCAAMHLRGTRDILICAPNTCLAGVMCQTLLRTGETAAEPSGQLPVLLTPAF